MHVLLTTLFHFSYSRKKLKADFLFGSHHEEYQHELETVISDSTSLVNQGSGITTCSYPCKLWYQHIIFYVTFQHVQWFYWLEICSLTELCAETALPPRIVVIASSSPSKFRLQISGSTREAKTGTEERRSALTKPSRAMFISPNVIICLPCSSPSTICVSRLILAPASICAHAVPDWFSLCCAYFSTPPALSAHATYPHRAFYCDRLSYLLGTCSHIELTRKSHPICRFPPSWAQLSNPASFQCLHLQLHATWFHTVSDILCAFSPPPPALRALYVNMYCL